MSIRELREAVEAGRDDSEKWRPAFGNHAFDGMAAFHGSLDAAKRLHDALLPGWGGAAGYDYYTGLCRSQARVSHMGRHYQAHIDDATQVPCPARAWLIAILRALEEEGRDG